jgi:hypothetical protein
LVCPGHNSLRLQCSILQRSNNVVLNLGCGFALSTDRPCIGNEDVALVVNGLGWKGDEIACARACFRGDKETARGGLVQGDGDDISDAKPECVGPALVFERRRKSWGIAAEHFQNRRRHAHEGIRQALGILLALPNVCALRARCRHNGTATQHDGSAERNKACEDSKFAHSTHSVLMSN